MNKNRSELFGRFSYDDSLTYETLLAVEENLTADLTALLVRANARQSELAIRAALGAHIEMTTTPGRDYAHEAPTHPDEHPLELGADAIGELQRGLHAVPDGSLEKQVHDRFIINPVPSRER